MNTSTERHLDALASFGRRSFGFVRRHKWSLPLATLSALFFLELASELRENELHDFDAAIAGLVVRSRGQIDTLMLTLTQFGGWLSMAALTVVAALLFALRRRPKEAVFLLLSAGGALLLNTALKLFFRRARPDLEVPYLIDAPSSFSFPSGHAMGSTGVLLSLLVILHVRVQSRALELFGIGLAALAILGIAASRIYFGVHYPSDVFGGVLAGAAWVSAVTGWFYPRLLPGEAAASGPPVSNPGPDAGQQ
ncbi:MAG TPA: phosphatase PAP2 family protein [Polyangiaceae bacterium]